MDQSEAQATGGIVEFGGFTVIGMGLDCPGYDFSGVGELWNRFMARRAELPAGGTAYGVSIPGQGGAYYLAAVEVPEGSEHPAGMEPLSVHSGRYFRLPFDDHPSQLSAAFGRIYKELLPAAGESPVQGGPILEEYSGDWHDEAAGKFHIKLYVPLA